MTVQQHTLSNGFRIVTEQMAGLKSASIGIWVTAGGRDERADQNGIAHFLEHMAFKGTERRTALQIAEAIEDVGGYINAYTSREMTAYYARVLENDVPLALDVLADILLNPVFDQNEIEVERGVILQEIGQAHDTPDDVIFDWLQEEAYPNQALGRTILGPSERVSSFSRADLSDFIGEHYGPDQMILSAAGAVDPDELLALAEKLFGHLPPRSQPHKAEAAAFAGGERRVVKGLEQAHFALAFEGPDYRDPGIYAAQVHAIAMGGGMSSRLFQELRENRGLCYTIFAQAGAYADTGLMTVYAGTSADQLGDLATLTIDELKRAADDMSAQEVARARSQMKAGLLMGLESPSNRAERLARMVAIWGKVPTIEDTIERIDSVTTGDVRAFGSDLVTRSAAAMALYGPIDEAPTLEALKARLVA
ncbi:pitrilysin family protein [Octadecabacter sp. 1_MG-2023]|uniref:M16 family metallopeptidase n=1 Tax=unclassified Octadecabacter TaxID=196158 RepID=UPI001C09401C|nr:pitrilysin family protein [Octadecabacter sp. 1_MG-2023]MBU2992025.1 insulinase family protein [Octadecabacter sp. B2R22]MDO6736000.1 pitrilysin family protein [Octadecabacter sp. 1_MG-2023]